MLPKIVRCQLFDDHDRNAYKIIPSLFIRLHGNYFTKMMDDRSILILGFYLINFQYLNNSKTIEAYSYC